MFYLTCKDAFMFRQYLQSRTSREKCDKLSPPPWSKLGVQQSAHWSIEKLCCNNNLLTILLVENYLIDHQAGTCTTTGVGPSWSSCSERKMLAWWNLAVVVFRQLATTLTARVFFLSSFSKSRVVQCSCYSLVITTHTY